MTMYDFLLMHIGRLLLAGFEDAGIVYKLWGVGTGGIGLALEGVGDGGMLTVMLQKTILNPAVS